MLHQLVVVLDHQLVVVLEGALDDVDGALLRGVVDRRPAEFVGVAELFFGHLLPHLDVDVLGRHHGVRQRLAALLRPRLRRTVVVGRLEYLQMLTEPTRPRVDIITIQPSTRL